MNELRRSGGCGVGEFRKAAMAMTSGGVHYLYPLTVYARPHTHYSPPIHHNMQAIRLQKKYPEVTQDEMFELINRFKSVCIFYISPIPPDDIRMDE